MSASQLASTLYCADPSQGANSRSENRGEKSSRLGRVDDMYDGGRTGLPRSGYRDSGRVGRECGLAISFRLNRLAAAFSSPGSDGSSIGFSIRGSVRALTGGVPAGAERARGWLDVARRCCGRCRRTRHVHPPGVHESTPTRGQSSAKPQRSHKGLRALHTWRPWWISRCE